MKRIWFVSHYSMPPQYEMRVKTQKYAHYLGSMGYDVTIFSASTIHNTDINLIADDSPYIVKKYDDLNFVHIRCDGYKGNGIQRIKNMQQFASRFVKIAKEFPQPDVVVADVNCTNYKQIYNYCKQRAIPFYIDMRDLWPMSIVEYNKYSEHNPIIKYLYHRERVMYKNATGTIFSMPGGKDYIADKKWEDIGLDKFHYINNGVDIESFYNEIETNYYQDAELDDEGIFKVVYAGSVRMANNLLPVVQAAKILADRGLNNIKIFIFGDGDDRQALETFCKENNVSNVLFKGLVEKKYIPNILSRCDLSILNYKKAKTLKYGGSQNKLFEYLAAGTPVLMTVDMNYNIVTENNCGIALDEPSPLNIANAIVELRNMGADDRKQMSERAKQVASEYDFKELTNKLLKIIGKEDM